MSEPYMFPSIGKLGAEMLINRSKEDGTFLVRSWEKEGHVLSCFWKRKFLHFLITRKDDEFLINNKSFGLKQATLPELIKDMHSPMERFPVILAHPLVFDADQMPALKAAVAKHMQKMKERKDAADKAKEESAAAAPASDDKKEKNAEEEAAKEAAQSKEKAATAAKEAEAAEKAAADAKAAAEKAAQAERERKEREEKEKLEREKEKEAQKRADAEAKAKAEAEAAEAAAAAAEAEAQAQALEAEKARQRAEAAAAAEAARQEKAEEERQAREEAAAEAARLKKKAQERSAKSMANVAEKATLMVSFSDDIDIEHSMVFEVNLQSIMRPFMEAIADRVHIDVDKLVFTFSGKTLTERSKFSKHGISNGSTVDVALK